MATVKISDKLYDELQQLIKHWDSPASPDELVELALDHFLTEHWPDQETTR